MKFPYSYFEDEVKDGYYVDSLMKCCWAAQEEILDTIDRICRKHHIQYFAEWGTLLGTVRHGGFIPWDDDMDISMKRPDYNKFLKVAEAELPEGYHIMNYRNDGDYWDVMSRVVNSEKICFDQDFLDRYHEFPFSTGIDIFPMDFLPTSKGEAEVLKHLVEDVKNTADLYGEGYLVGEALEERLKQLEILCNRKISREGDLREHLYDIVVSLYALYHEDESEEIALIPLWIDNGSRAYPKKYYAEAVRLPFDRTTIPVPIAYDALLKEKYGDYMKMVRKGGSHDYPYYKAQIKIMENCGSSLPCFRYEDRTVRNENMQKKKVQLGAENLLVLENAHIGLIKLLLIHDYDTAMQLLSRCQECAISLGDKVEGIVAECDDMIHSLEEYCELIYQVHQLLRQDETLDPEGVHRILQEQLQIIRNNFAEEHQYKKKIVFIIDKAARWNSFESVWRAAKEDENNIVSVIIVPYYYRRFDGTILEEHYERELLPEYVETLDYQRCDLAQYHPDIIFINSPYDEYNYFASIHPNFYSSRLVQYTEKLIYIPWFTITELTREDERGWQSMKHFVTMPGVVNADKVIVQSEQMRGSYIEYLTEWAGEETRSIWEEKISGVGSALMDRSDESQNIEDKIPSEWKDIFHKKDGSRKKAILYSISGTGFAEYGEKAIDKLHSVLNIFKENKEEIVMIWYPNQAIEAALRFTHPDLWESYDEAVQQFLLEGWGIYAKDTEEELLVSICDAYYGDACKLSQAVVVAGKPVMLQNFECVE